MNRKFFKTAALAMALLMLTGCAAKEEERPELLEPVNASLETAIATRRSLGSMKVYEGEVIPDMVNIGFETEGYIYGIYARAGEFVNEGDVVASVVGNQFSKLESLEDEIKSIEEKNKDNKKLREAELELARLNGTDTAEMELKLKQEKELEDLKLNQKKARLEQLKAEDPGYSYVTSPCDGRVIAASTSRRGDYVSAGSPIAVVEGTGRPRITCGYINEKTANSLYSCYALIHGRQYEIKYVPYTKEELAEIAANDVTPVAVFELVGEDISGIEVGDYAAVITTADYVEDVLCVPVNAIYSEPSGKFVYEVINNVRVKKNVVTGVSDAIYIEIVSGIEEGAHVYVKN